MSLDQFTMIASVVSGIVGVVAVGLSLLAYVRLRHTSYRRLLQPLVMGTMAFTVAHGFVFLWSSHPLVVDLLEALTVTGIAVGVVRLIQLHPRMDTAMGGE
jgi:glucan phosphoethanolaminetransferase (alkaline phosphatase superfamily)